MTNTISGEISIPPIYGSTLRIGARTGSVSLYTIAANGLYGFTLNQDIKILMRMIII